MSMRLAWRALGPRYLHQQLVLMVSLLLLLAIVLLGGYTAAEQTAIARQGMQNQAASLARHMAVASANPILTDSLDEVEAQALRLSDFPEVMQLQVLDPQGRVLAHVLKSPNGERQRIFDPPQRRVPVPAELHAMVMDDVHQGVDLIVAWHPILAGSVVGWVRVDYAAQAMDMQRRRIWGNTAFVAALAVGLCWVLLVVLLRRPMKALARATRFAVNLGHLDGRQMPVEPGPAEIMELSGALNEASTRLYQQMLAIESAMQRQQEHEAQLSSQNEQLNALFTLSPDGLVIFNREGRVQFANQAFMALTGWQADDIIGRTQAQLEQGLRALPGGERGFGGLAPCFGDGGVAPTGQTLSLTAPRPRVLSLTGLHSQSASVSRVLYVVDITHQHLLDQMKSEFLSMAAHELRTPMASIYGFTELMLKREMSPEQRQDLLGRIYRQSQSMISILNELLDLARIEARRGQDFEFETLDLVEQVRAMLVDYQPPPERAAPELVGADEPLWVNADRHKLRQAVLNVLSNAYKYSPEGGPVTLRFVTRRETLGPGRVGLMVQDRGIGLKPEEQARLGERFFRADKSGNIPGTGLGVSIVKELLELMGGRLEVHSVYGQGTEVTLWLPRVSGT